MKRMKRFAFGAIAAVMLLGMASGCQKQAGPAEQAGKAVDNAVEKVGEQIEKVGDRIEDATKPDKKSDKK